jgi:hypothetical protein
MHRKPHNRTLVLALVMLALTGCASTTTHSTSTTTAAKPATASKPKPTARAAYLDECGRLLKLAGMGDTKSACADLARRHRALTAAYTRRHPGVSQTGAMIATAKQEASDDAYNLASP